MKLLVRKLWFRHSVDKTARNLFRIPQLRELFNEGYTYDGEMRPRGLKIYSYYWPADDVLERLPQSEKDVYLILTSRDLTGDNGWRINGKGFPMRAIASNDAYTGGVNKDKFDHDNPSFLAMAFGEIGHSLGLQHHEHNPQDPCEMSHNYYPNANCNFVEDVRFCDSCYEKIQRR